MTVEIKHRTPSAVGPVILVLAGALLLLFNLNALPEGAGWRLLLVSPLLLVMLGAQIVISRSVTSPVRTAVSLAVVGSIGLAGLAYVALGPGAGAAGYTTTSSSSPVAGLASGTLRVNAAGSRTSVIFGDTGTDLYRARLSYAGPAPKVNYANGELQIDTANRFVLDWGRSADQYTLTLSNSVPWTIVVNGAGTTTSVEMLAGHLQSFTQNGVGSDVQLSLGSPTGTVPIEVTGLGTKLTFSVPAGVQYRVSNDGLATTVSGPAATSGWASTVDRYDVTGSGLGTRIEVQSR